MFRVAETCIDCPDMEIACGLQTEAESFVELERLTAVRDMAAAALSADQRDSLGIDEVTTSDLELHDATMSGLEGVAAYGEGRAKYLLQTCDGPKQIRVGRLTLFSLCGSEWSGPDAEPITKLNAIINAIGYSRRSRASKALKAQMR